MKSQSVLIVSIVAFFLVITVPALSQQPPPDFVIADEDVLVELRGMIETLITDFECE